MSNRMLAAGLAVLLFAQGCASWEQKHRDGAVAGGLIGAGGGAIVGAMTGSWFWGALIGAGSGALAGYVIADNSADHRAPRSSDRAYGQNAREDADREFKLSMEAKDRASAEYHLRRSIDRFPTPAAHNNLGLLALQDGRRDTARANFREAIALDPRYEPALKNLEKMGT
jgi:tetratricopeptide (TPR) repeat protein